MTNKILYKNQYINQELNKNLFRNHWIKIRKLDLKLTVFHLKGNKKSDMDIEIAYLVSRWNKWDKKADRKNKNKEVNLGQ